MIALPTSTDISGNASHLRELFIDVKRKINKQIVRNIYLWEWNFHTVDQNLMVELFRGNAMDGFAFAEF